VSEVDDHGRPTSKFVEALQFSDELPIEVRGRLTTEEYTHVIDHLNGMVREYCERRQRMIRKYKKKIMWIMILAIPTMGFSSFGLICAASNYQRSLSEATTLMDQDVNQYLRRVNDTLFTERGVQLRFNLQSMRVASPEDMYNQSQLQYHGNYAMSLTFGMAPVSLPPNSSFKGGIDRLREIQ
jgi:hypothetical protein